MKRTATTLAALALLTAAAMFSASGARGVRKQAELSVKVADVNPWTHLKLNNRPKNFQFAIITDRTGGRRPGVFTQAIDKINLLQPEFVMTVGDMIQGYTEDPGQWALEWAEFESKVDKLQMPFFFCAGNHDFSNMPMSDEWHRKFGRSYYHFRYHNTLFVVLNTEEKPKKGRPYFFSVEQQQWLAGVLETNTDVRWTFVILHKPAWTYVDDDPDLLGWTAIETALAGRRHTVFAGHKHNYAKYIRNGNEYYMLATTGGGSDLSGLKNGRFDHFVWVTMKEDGPVIANLLLDGVEDKNVRRLPNPVRTKK